MRRVVPAAAVVLFTAACSAGAHTAPAVKQAPSSAAPHSAPATSPSPVKVAASPSPAGTPAAASIIRSTAGHGLPPGPFKVTPVKCGAYTAAEKAKFGTTAKGGLIFKYTNASNSLTDAVKLDVSFLAGTSVLGENVNGQAPDTAPGQSGEAAVDAVGGSGGDLTFSTCELNTYSLLGSPVAGSYAP